MTSKPLTRTLALLLTLLLLAGCGGAGAKKGSVTVGSKDFSENILLGEMVAQLIESNTDIKVTRKLNLGGTKVNFDGIKRGNLDIYPDYDGTGWGIHLGHTEKPDPKTLLDQVRKEFEEKYKLTWSGSLGFNNTYALAMPEALAKQHNLKTYTDLAKVSNQFVFGTTNEFMGRESDGYNPLVQAYGFNFKDVRKMTAGLRYPAMQQNEIQVMDAYATDGKLKEFKLMVLKDDKNFFPPYNAAYIVRQDTITKNPGLMDVINKLSGKITNEEMQNLNYRVEVGGETPAAVAKDFLTGKGLIK